MHRPGMSLVLVCALAGAAAAQTPAPSEPAPSEPAPGEPVPAPSEPAPGEPAPLSTGPASAPSLEQRVTEQLAAQGIALSRRNLGVRIQQTEGPWTVALVDLGNGRVAASIQLDAPADPAAALPVVTRAARRPRLRDVALAPYLGRTDAGLALGARF